MDSLCENGCSDLHYWPVGPIDFKEINVAELTCARNSSLCYCSNVLTMPQYRWKFSLGMFKLQKLQCEDGSTIKPGPQDDKLDSKSDNNADQERNTESDPQRLVYGSVTQADVEEFKEKDTPLGRIKRTYDFWSHQHLNRTPQEYNLFKSSTTIVLSLLGFNWYKGYLDAKTSFRKKYALVVFRSQGQAQKRRYNYLMHTTLGYGLKTTWKMSKFLLPLLIGQQLLEVYLNRTTPASFAISSGTVSCLSGFSLGPKGMFSRFVIGTGAGLCSSISHLPDLARGFLKTTEFKQLPAAVDKMRNKLDELKNDCMKDQASLKDSYKNIIAEIKALRKEINQILDKLEKKTVEQLDSMMEDLEKPIKDDLETCVHMDDQLKTMIEKLQQVTGKNKETNSYIGFRVCQSKLSEANSLVQEIRQKEGMKFKSDESVLPFLRNLNSLGTVENPNSIHVYKAQSSSLYKVRIKEDKSKCHIAGICEMPSGEIVMTDYRNRRLKLLNRHYEVIDHFDMPSFPHNLCHTTGNEVAVAVGGSDSKSNGVHFFTVTKGQLQTVRKFTIDYDCHPIAHHQGKLYVGCTNDLYLYTTDGRLVNKIYEDKSKYITVCRCAVSPDGERIYVTNPIASKLITLDTSGQVLSTLDPDLKQPTGLCVSPSGHVFVCGCISNTVVQVDPQGRQVAIVARETDSISLPQSVWFIEQTSTLIVGQENEDNITVLKLC